MENAMELKTPKTLMEAIRYFADPAIAEAYMVSKRWPDGVKCPHCGSTKVYRLEKQRRWKCANKHPLRQFTVKVGTVMEDSPLPLDKWLCATWMIVNAKNGISSYEIHRGLGITQKSAWFLDHRIRLALKAGTFEKLSGTVEADESYVGGKVGNMKKAKQAALRAEHKEPGKPPKIGGRMTLNKAIVMGLLERGRDGQPSQMHTTMIESARRPHIQGAVREHVEPNSILMTDALSSYKGLQAEYIHMAINHALSYAKGRIHTNGYRKLLEPAGAGAGGHLRCVRTVPP
jgi:transposase-like protein